MEFLDFEAFLKQKRIDPESFRKSDPVLYDEFRNVYDKAHPASFTAQKLFQINRTRRKYPYSGTPPADTPSAAGHVKPRIPVKPKIG